MPYLTKQKGNKLYLCQVEIQIHQQQTQEINVVKRQTDRYYSSNIPMSRTWHQVQAIRN